MVNYRADLNSVFGALSDPTRRAIVSELAKRESLPVGDLARPFRISLPAITKHLGVLERAGLISRARRGRTVRCRLNVSPMREAMAWLSRYERFWSERLDSLTAYLEASSMTDTEDIQLSLVRRIKAKPARVFAAWTTPEGLKAWFGPSDDFNVALAETDLRIGGKYRIWLRAPDGNEHRVGGVYREIVPNRRLAFTWAWETSPEQESFVTVEFADRGSETELTLTHVKLADKASRDAHLHGWTGSLERLQRYAGKLPR